MDYVLKLLPIFIMLAESLMGGGTGEAKKKWVIAQITSIVEQLMVNEAQKDETWAAIMAILNMEYPDVPDVPDEPKPQSFLGKLIDLFAGLFT
jgi:hypothetical protein